MRNQQDKTSPVYVTLDLKRIFLTPPNTRKEKILLVVIMTLSFMVFFGPLTFTEISPIRAILVSCMPALSISWGWMVFLRYIGRKAEFSKERAQGDEQCF